MSQTIITSKDLSSQIADFSKEKGCKKFMLVCGNSFKKSFMMKEIENLDLPFCIFSDFTPNPDYNEVLNGIRLFNAENCDLIIAAGGGSAIDVAKCIKLFCKSKTDENYLKQDYFDTKVPLLAIPTTAGTGSESTKFAVIYFEGEKQSVHHESILPDCAVLAHEFLKSLPVYQKKCTMMDALCQAVESWWSVRSDDKCKSFAKEAIELIVKYGDDYIFNNSNDAAKQIMRASNLAGQAINITATTAPHAMSYKLTTLYGLPHGHSVGLALSRVWDYMIDHPELCTDKRGEKYLNDTFFDIAAAFSAQNPKEAVGIFRNILEEYELVSPVSNNKKADLEILASSVNVERLGNNPVALSYETLYGLYDLILEEGLS